MSSSLSLKSGETLIMHKKIFFILNLLIVSSALCQNEAVPDPDQGIRADWMRGAVGMLWLPENNYNGNIEGISIEPFLNQIAHLKTVDYIQLPLASPSIYSPVHVAPHPILEALWEGDRNANGKPINLIVPRATANDPLLEWLKAVKAAGLKTEIYLNSFNMLARNPDSPPGAFPDVSARWEEFCNTDPTVQTFIDSKSYHTDGVHERRPYMFIYAEFILKEYAVRYGDLIDAWCFDSADNIMDGGAGDDPSSGNLEDQRIYQAFANAVHIGNPKAAVAFNNSVGTAARPFATPTLFEDYTFGHPFGGAGNMVETESLYNRNYGICEYMSEHEGHPFASTDDRAFNDKVVGHFFPKQSTTSWNSGAKQVLTDEQFVEWNDKGLIDGGAITWGTPLKIVNLLNLNAQANLVLQDYALRQFELLDEHLMKSQYPGAPNWSRSNTILGTAHFGVPYSHSLVEDIDFWDPEGDEITDITVANQPDWLKIEKTGSGEWTLSGVPTEDSPQEYEFQLIVSDASGSRDREVVLKVVPEDTSTTFSSDVQIQAIANTNYGVDSLAVMISGLQMAPDSLATYRIAVTLRPNSGNAIVSGESGGSTTAESFGIGANNSDKLFTGSDSDWIESIGNIEILDFNANGGLYSEKDVSASFKSVVVANAQSKNDNVAVKFGELVVISGKTPTNNYELNLESLVGGTIVNNFSIGTGNTDTTNKWSINGLIVTVVFDSSNLKTPVSAVKIDRTDINLDVDEMVQLNAIISPSEANNPTLLWSSSDQTVATVDSYGVVTAVSEGTAIITAITEDGGFEDESTITVFTPFISVTGIEIEQEKLFLEINETARLNNIVGPTDASDQSIIWSSSDQSVATVDSYGVVTAVSEGTAIITAITIDGSFEDASTVTVSTPFVSVTGIEISQEDLFLEVTDSVLLDNTISPANASDQAITWSSSDDSIATVDANGLITAIAAGTVTITATTHDGSLIAQRTISVVNTEISVKFQIAPNPVVSGDATTVYYNYEKNSGLASLALYDIAYKEIDITSVKLKIGSNQMELKTNGLAKGIYILAFSDSNGFSETVKVLVE